MNSNPSQKLGFLFRLVPLIATTLTLVAVTAPAQEVSSNSSLTVAASQESFASISNRWRLVPLPQTTSAAEKGDVSAQYYLGCAYSFGYGVEQNPAEGFKWTKMAADQGFAKALRRLGWMYQHGSGTEKDIPASNEWYRKAAELGDAPSEMHHGLTFTLGDLETRNYPEAEKWLRRAADQGTAEAQFQYAHLLTQEFDKTGKWVPNFAVAGEWYLKAANQGHTEAQYELAKMYETGQLGDPQRTNCIPWFLKAAAAGNAEAQAEIGNLPTYFPNSELLKSVNVVDSVRRAAENGNVDAQFEMAQRYQVGDGVSQDATQAFNWMTKAAEHDLSQGTVPDDATFELAKMYEHGEGVAQNLTKAYELYQKAARGGFLNNGAPLLRLGLMYENGEGVPQDDRQAAACYMDATQFGMIVHKEGRVRQGGGGGSRIGVATTSIDTSGRTAAENLLSLYVQGRGFPENKSEITEQLRSLEGGMTTAKGCYLVGEIYYQGKLVQKENSSAAQWFTKAAKQGSPEAMNRLGEMWASGLAGAADAKEAAKWYRKAALAGLATAQFNLAEACLKGEGVQQDRIEGCAWLQLAARQNLPAARDESTKVMANLSTDERASVDALATKLASRANPQSGP